MLLDYVLALADDQLILGHRLSEWCGKAPTLEEEMALANMGLDLIGQARHLYQYAAELDTQGRSEDDLAYLRDERAYRNVLLLERPRGDFAYTQLRQYCYSSLMVLFWQAMQQSQDQRLADIAAKAVPEMQYHVQHSGEWVLRLGLGTTESANRLNAAWQEILPYLGELFQMDTPEQALCTCGIAVDRHRLEQPWHDQLNALLQEVGLFWREVYPQSGGREGRHSEALGYLLCEMQYLQRTHPGARW